MHVHICHRHLGVAVVAPPPPQTEHMGRGGTLLQQQHTAAPPTPAVMAVGHVMCAASAADAAAHDNRDTHREQYIN